VAPLLVGALAREVTSELAGVPYFVGLGKWSIPARGWREFVATAERGKKRTTVASSLAQKKPGKTTTLSPIIAGLVVEGIAKEAGVGRGSTSLGIRLASLLRGSTVTLANFGRWRRAALRPADSLLTDNSQSAPPATLDEWLVFRWRSAYDIAFQERSGFWLRRYWSTFLVEAADNPLALFGPLANLEVLSLLYGIPWFHPPSARRTGRSSATSAKRLLHDPPAKG
jgi:hypothetical protein